MAQSLIFVLCWQLVWGSCPYLGSVSDVQLPANHPPVLGKSASTYLGSTPRDSLNEYVAAVKKLNFDAVRTDLLNLINSSQPAWPADYGSYGPLLLRLAWHCAGTYRKFDGRGGCDGGRIRFAPENSWGDNTNLDKAQNLLWPIKQKYGTGLSWGDLIIFAGNTAIESMGGEVLGFCAGRFDDADGTASKPLVPAANKDDAVLCAAGEPCGAATEAGLIYVNPEGPNGNPDPAGSALQIRDTFSRMGMNDTETVALIGMGHSVGKAHGACPAGAGPSPTENPFNPWPGLCRTGKAADTFTSGFEGPWTTHPTQISNVFFRALNALDSKWKQLKSPAGRVQWTADGLPLAPAAHGDGKQLPMMLTSDIALIRDPAGVYQPLVKQFAANATVLTKQFAAAWYKLTTLDMGPASRCLGPKVPPPQPFQASLPAPSLLFTNFKSVREQLVKVLRKTQPGVAADLINGKPYHGAMFVRLAFQCASTFRSSDFRGGCNGARIRFAPENAWAANEGLDAALRLLDTVKRQFPASLSWADLIVLAGNTALEDAGAPSLPFCAGRSDARDGSGSENLEPSFNANNLASFRNRVALLGLTPSEYTALMGMFSLGRNRLAGTWTTTPAVLSNSYFVQLLSEDWQRYLVPNSDAVQYKARGKNLFILPTDFILRVDPTFRTAAQAYAADNAAFLRAFSGAWTKLMTADLFDGPLRNICKAPLYFGSSTTGSSTSGWSWSWP